MRADGVAIRHDAAERDLLAGGGPHAGDFAAVRQDLFNLHAGAELHAEPAGELFQRERDGARAADRIPDAFIGLHVRDAAEHGGRAGGRRADILREVIDHLRDARVGREFAHRARDRPPHPHREDIAEHLRIERRLPLEHVADAADRFVEKVPLRNAVQPRAVVDEFAVAPAGIRARGKGIERSCHRLGVLREIEHRAVVEEAAPLRIEPHEFEVVLEPRARLGEDAAEHRRDRDDRRPHVEAEAFLVELRGLAAEPVVAFEKRDLPPARREHTCRGKSRESAADDADGFHELLPRTFAMSAAKNSRSAPSRRRPCAARM